MDWSKLEYLKERVAPDSSRYYYKFLLHVTLPLDRHAHSVKRVRLIIGAGTPGSLDSRKDPPYRLYGQSPSWG